LVKDLEDQNFLTRYAHQDDNKGRIESSTKLLDEAIELFEMNLQMSVHRLHTETSQVMKNTFLELDDLSRERHDEVLDLSRMSEKERELLTKILDCAQFGKISIPFFFIYLRPKNDIKPDIIMSGVSIPLFVPA